MSTTTVPPDIAALLGADLVSATIPESTRADLVKILDKQVIPNVPDFSKPLEHRAYLELRAQYAAVASLAGVAGDQRLSEVVGNWLKLQEGYAKQVIKETKEGVKDLRELLTHADDELRRGEADRERYRTLSGKRAGDLTDEEFDAIRTLKAKIATLDKTAQDREQWHRAVANVSRVEETLTALLKSGATALHYVVPSVAEAQDRLGKGVYDGPDFKPFTISNKVRIEDIFQRGVQILGREPRPAAPNGDMPAVLLELVRVYNYITEQPNGALIDPSVIRDELHLQELGAKGIGSYLEDNPGIFGVGKVDRAGSRKFTKKQAPVMGDEGFIEQMVGTEENEGKLQSLDRKKVNEFYFQKALALLREDPIAYQGFRSEDIMNIAERHHLRVSKMYAGKNLSRRTEELGLATTVTAGEYTFARIVPTETQVSYTRQALDEFGRNRFTVQELVSKIHAQHQKYRILVTVAQTVLDEKAAEWNLRQVESDPVRYQVSTSPSATPAKAAAPAGNGTPLI